MPFCTQCGTRLEEGQVHVCTVQQNTKTAIKVEFKTIIELIKNPFGALRFTEEEFLYGILGLGGIIISVLLVFVAVYHNLISGLNSLFSFGESLNYFYVFLIAAWIIALQMVCIYIFARWRGEQKLMIKAAVAKLGSTQFFASLCFLIAALLSFISMSFSLGAFLIVLIINIIILFVASIDAFRIAEEQRLSMIALAVTTYIVAQGLGIKYYLDYVLENFGWLLWG